VVAYRVKRYQISSPDWMASERFDITAKLPAGGSPKEMQESPPDSPKATQGFRPGFDAATNSRPGGFTVDYGNGDYFTFADNKIEGRKMSFSNLAGRPVVDMTILKGNYDFVLELSPEDFRAM
jgi:uncharacterized protein (TIGR03435 family)